MEFNWDQWRQVGKAIGFDRAEPGVNTWRSGKPERWAGFRRTLAKTNTSGGFWF
jgi:hypothetical protein